MTENTTPTYEGRTLPKPDEELVDQGLQFDIGTLLSRRGLLGLLGGGAAMAALTACGATTEVAASAATPTPTAATATAAAGALTEIPDETAGPYPGDGSNGADVLEQSGVVRSDIRSSFGSSTRTAPGVPMTLELTMVDMANGNVPMVDAAVYVWHCDRDGNYSMYSNGVTGENYLRGVQVTDAQGVVRYTSIFPACYSGRWPHIHFEVYPDQASIIDATKAVCTSQVALPKEVCDTVYATTGYSQSVKNLASLSLKSDNVFGDDGGEHQLATVSGDVTSGYTVRLTVGVDTRTTPTGGGMAGGGRGPGGTPPTGAPGSR